VVRLVLINGMPASGKSTLARRYADDHPLTLALDIDVVRAMLGGWLTEPTEAGLLARRLALAVAGEQLRAGHDVVVPQFLGRLDFVLSLKRLAEEADAEFREFALLISPEQAVERFRRRSSRPETYVHLDAHVLLEREGGLGQLAAMHTALHEVLARRPDTMVIESLDGQVERAYRAMVEHLR